MKMRLIAALSAACIALSASAQHTTHDGPTYSQWIGTTNASLADSLDRIRMVRFQSGTAIVRFTCSDDGRAANVTIVQRANPELDRAARRTVMGMKSMHPLYSGFKADQVYEAAIIVASDQTDMQRRLAALDDRVRRQDAYWASRGVPNPVISLAMTSAF
jgi:TonB family protein